LHKTSR